MILKSIQHLQDINVNDEWETPNDLFADACIRYNLRPILDVCATKENTKCIIYITKENDSLNQIWNKNFFMNPPYSEITQWMQKAYSEHKKHDVDAIILVYAKTDTKWWHKYVEGIAEVHFIKGRIKFVKPDGTVSKNSAPYPSCFIIYRKKK